MERDENEKAHIVNYTTSWPQLIHHTTGSINKYSAQQLCNIFQLTINHDWHGIIKLAKPTSMLKAQWSRRAKERRRSCTRSSISKLHKSKRNPIPSHGVILPIAGGSSVDFKNKRKRRSYFKRVHAILPEGACSENTLVKIELLVTLGDMNNPRNERTSSNVILRRGFLNTFKAIVHEAYLCMKLPAAEAIITARDIEKGITPG